MRRLIALLLLLASSALAQAGQDNPAPAIGSTTTTTVGTLTTGGINWAGNIATTGNMQGLSLTVVAGAAQGNAILSSGGAGIGTYNTLSLNGVVTAAGIAGVYGGGTGGDLTTYLAGPAGVQIRQATNAEATFNGGTTIGTPTGGAKGIGTLNPAGAVYDNGTLPTGTAASGYVRATSPTIATPTLSSLTTGTNADFLCLSGTGAVLLQTSACTISSLRFKNFLAPYDSDPLATVRRLGPIVFRMKEGETPNPDRNYPRVQIGLSAENVARVEPRCAIYENDGKTPKSYRQECLIAVLISAVQAQQREINALRHR